MNTAGGPRATDVYAYDDDDDSGRSVLRVAIGACVVLVLAGLAWFVVRPELSGDDEAGGVVPIEAASTPPDVSPAGDEDADASTPSASDADEPATTGSGVGSSTPASGPAPSSAPATSDDDGDDPSTTTTQEPPPSSTSTTDPEGTAPTTDAVSTSAPERTTTTASATYDTLPDGSPVPVVATFGVDTVRLQGVVPSRDASERLAGLARANARDPATVEVVNELTLNPAVPTNVGVRVIELTSTRFPPGSSEVFFEHALELDRVATVMDSLKNVTVLVVGHADQIGDANANLALSRERAVAVVDYLIGKGVDGARLSARAVGEDDLLTIDNDATALALNRRTEFIFYGLLIE